MARWKIKHEGAEFFRVRNSQVAMRPGKPWAQYRSRKRGGLVNQIEKLKPVIRAKVGHPFRVGKRQFGCMEVHLAWSGQEPRAYGRYIGGII
jgi:hypothetical protein